MPIHTLNKIFVPKLRRQCQPPYNRRYGCALELSD